MSYVQKRRIQFDAVFVIAFILFILWILLALAWCKRYNVGPLLWFCDIALLMTAIGLFLRSGLILTAQLTALLIFHFGWNLDFGLYLFWGHSLIGSTAYMFYHDLTLYEKCLSFFSHVFVIPAAFYGIIILGVSRKAWIFQWGQTLVLFLLTYLITRPEENINWMFGNELLSIKPDMITPILYYVLMIVIPPVFVYWPTNILICTYFNPSKDEKYLSSSEYPFSQDGTFSEEAGGRSSRVEITTTIVVTILAILISFIVSQKADKKCVVDTTFFQVGANCGAPLETMPLSMIKTRVDDITFGEREYISKVPLLTWNSKELPKQWSGYDQKLHIHTKALLNELNIDSIPAAPQEVMLRGKRVVLGSIVWAFVASDSFYIQKKCDLNSNNEMFDVPCAIGGHGVSEYVSPLTGKVYISTSTNEVYGCGIGSIYALCIVEVYDNVIVSRSPYYLVKRTGIRCPEDVWFISKNGEMLPLLSNPADPLHGQVAFQSTPTLLLENTDVYLCNYNGYEMRNLTYKNNKFDGFVALNSRASEGNGWIDTNTLRYYTEIQGEFIAVNLNLKR